MLLSRRAGRDLVAYVVRCPDCKREGELSVTVQNGDRALHAGAMRHAIEGWRQ